MGGQQIGDAGSSRPSPSSQMSRMGSRARGCGRILIWWLPLLVVMCSQHRCDSYWSNVKWWAWFRAPFTTEDHLRKEIGPPICLVQVFKPLAPTPSWESCWFVQHWAIPQLLSFFLTSVLSSWNQEDFWKCFHILREAFKELESGGNGFPSSFQSHYTKFPSSFVVTHPPANHRHTISVTHRKDFSFNNSPRICLPVLQHKEGPSRNEMPGFSSVRSLDV